MGVEVYEYQTTPNGNKIGRFSKPKDVILEFSIRDLDVPVLSPSLSNYCTMHYNFPSLYQNYCTMHHNFCTQLPYALIRSDFI